LSGADQWRLVRSAALLLATRAGIASLGYERIRRLLVKSHSRQQVRTASADEIERLAWALNTAARYVLGNHDCLTLAMSGQYTLNRRGIETDLRIGVKRDAAGALEAHAWLEKSGRILIGTPASAEHQLLPVVNVWG